jgi:hypothetical protein
MNRRGIRDVSPTDVRCERRGPMVLVRPLTDNARGWINEHVRCEAEFMGEGLAVAPHQVDDLLDRMAEYGLKVEG